MRGDLNRQGMRGWTRKKRGRNDTRVGLCSRNAHDENVLVRRPQSGLTRVPFQKRRNEQSWWDLFHGRACNAHDQKGRTERPGALLARRTRTIKRCSFDARSKGQPWPLPRARRCDGAEKETGGPRFSAQWGSCLPPSPRSLAGRSA